MDSSLTERRPPEFMPNHHPTSPPIRQAGEAENGCPANMVDQPVPTQGISDALVLPERKRKHTNGVEAGPTKKRKKVDNSQNSATNVDMNGDISNELCQGAVRSIVERSMPWTLPVPTEHDKRAGVQVLKPAPASRFASRGASGKKGRSNVWHVWSEVRNCTRTNYSGCH